MAIIEIDNEPQLNPVRGAFRPAAGGIGLNLTEPAPPMQVFPRTRFLRLRNFNDTCDLLVQPSQIAYMYPHENGNKTCLILLVRTGLENDELVVSNPIDDIADALHIESVYPVSENTADIPF